MTREKPKMNNEKVLTYVKHMKTSFVNNFPLIAVAPLKISITMTYLA